MTTKKAWLGLFATLALAACSSKDPLLNGQGGGGAGGAASAGAGGTASGGTTGTGGTASGGTTGTGGGTGCQVVECLRPYECVRMCGGPIVRSSCCACEAPLFDNFQNRACGGSGGAGATGGAGGTGAIGVAGRGGTGGAGATGGAGGATGGSGATGGAGRGGTGGRGGAGGAGATGGSTDAGADARLCEQVQCVRPYECKRACGGRIEYTGCCACEAPLFDDFMGMACGDGGAAAVSYIGCNIVGGLNRLVISKRDTGRNLCVSVGLVEPTAPPSGLTLPGRFGLEWTGVGTASECPVGRTAQTAAPVTGSVAFNPTDAAALPTLNVDIVVELPGNDEALITRDLDVNRQCGAL